MNRVWRLVQKRVQKKVARAIKCCFKNEKRRESLVPVALEYYEAAEMDAADFIKAKRFFAFEDYVRIVTRLDFRAEIAPELLLFAGIYGRDKSRVACVHA